MLLNTLKSPVLNSPIEKKKEIKLQQQGKSIEFVFDERKYVSSIQTLLQTTQPPSTLSLQHLFVLLIYSFSFFFRFYFCLLSISIVIVMSGFRLKCFSFYLFIFLRPRVCHCILLLLVSSS